MYDDVRGWNHDPYIGAGEFYLEYGSFDVALTLPASYIVARPEPSETRSRCSRRPSARGWAARGVDGAGSNRNQR